MDTKILLAIISAILIAAPWFIYIYSLFKGETKPHIYSRFLYFILTFIACIIQIQNEGGYGSVALIVMSSFCFIVFLLSFKYGTKDITASDGLFLVLGLSVIPLWLVMENPLYSVILLVIVDFFATLPTIRKTIVAPDSENQYFYLVGSIGLIFSLLLIEKFSIVNSLYLLFILFINTWLYLIIIWKRKVPKVVSK